MKSTTTRPTTQKIREAIFNILSAKISGASFLDLFAGTGMIGIDAYLYGAEKVFLVENNHNALKTIEQNIKKRGLAQAQPGRILNSGTLTGFRDTSRDTSLKGCVPRVRMCPASMSPDVSLTGLAAPDPIILIKQDAIKFLKNCGHKFDIIFIDPPYETRLGDEALKIIDEKKLLNENGIIIFEHYHKKEFVLNLHNISIIKEKKYGQTKLTFLSSK